MGSVPQAEKMFLPGLTVFCHPIILKLPQPDPPMFLEAPKPKEDTPFTQSIPKSKGPQPSVYMRGSMFKTHLTPNSESETLNENLPL